jgi:hypothetical protein
MADTRIADVLAVSEVEPRWSSKIIEKLLLWSLSRSHTRPTRVRSSKQEIVGYIEIMMLKFKIIKQNNEGFYQPNPGVDYISHSSVQLVNKATWDFC